MAALKNFPEEYVKSLRTSFSFLRGFNIRYLEDDIPFWKKYWRFYFNISALCIHVIGMGSQMTVMVIEDEMSQFAYALAPFLCIIHAVLKTWFLIPKTAEISAFIRQLGILWTTKITRSESEEKNKILWRLNVCNKATYWVTVSASLQYLFSPLLETLFRRFILQQNCQLMLPVSLSYPLNPTENWVIYVFVYISQVYTISLLISVYVGAPSMLISLCALLTINFVTLKDDLAKLSLRSKNRLTNSTEYYDNSIEEFVKKHQVLLRLSRQLDNIFNRMIFIDLLFVGITTCAFSFAGNFARGPTYMLNNYVAVAYSMLTILYLCYYGELLTEASARIGDLAYENLWYKGDMNFRRATWLIIKMSQKTCCLTSMKYAMVSLNLFTKIIITTYSYFSLMNSVYSRKI